MTSHLPRPQRVRENQPADKKDNSSLLVQRLLAWRPVGYVLAAGLVLFVIANSWIMPLMTRQGESFELTSIVGLHVSEARELLEEQGLDLQVSSEEYNPSYKDGEALSQYPLAGTMVKPGRVIKVVISLGEKDVVIPKVTGVSVRQAKLDLETAGLRIGDISWTYTDTLPEKLVVFSFPSPGDTVPIASKVNVLVNRGRGQGVTFMPSLIGLTLDEARDLLREKGLKAGLIMRRRDENYLPETVLEQSEAEATELEVGEEVDLVVSELE